MIKLGLILNHSRKMYNYYSCFYICKINKRTIWVNNKNNWYYKNRLKAFIEDKIVEVYTDIFCEE
jgi:hypothetical protein